MPIYEYRCERGHTFEVMQRMTDDPLTSCSTCSAPVQRVFHPVAVHFKGSGFYSTDYGKKKPRRLQSATIFSMVTRSWASVAMGWRLDDAPV